MMLLWVEVDARTGSVLRGRWERCLDFGEEGPGQEFGLPFGCRVCRGVLIYRRLEVRTRAS